MQPSRTDPAFTTSTPSPRVPRRPITQQPRRQWLPALLTAFALLTAGGAHAQTLTSATLDAEAGDLTLVFSGDISALMDGRIHIREVNTTTDGVVLSAQRGTLAGNTVDYDLTTANMVLVQAMTKPQLQFDLGAMTLAAEPGGGEPAGSFPRVFDVRDAVYSDTNLGVTGVEFNPSLSPTGIAFNTTGTPGTLMFLTDSNGDNVTRYTLGTAFDISTASPTTQSFNVGGAALGLVIVPTDIAFNPAGTKMVVPDRQAPIGASNRRTVSEYSLSTGYDLTSATFDGNLSYNSNLESQPDSVRFNEDGTQMLIAGRGTDRVIAWPLSTPYSFITAGSVGTPVPATTFPSSENPIGIRFNADGTRMYISSNTGDMVRQYDLTTAYDPSTRGSAHVGTTVVTATQMNLNDIAFNTTGDRMFTIGNSPARVHQFTLNPPRAIDVVDNTAPNILSAITDVSGVSIILTFDEPLMTNSPLASEFSLGGTTDAVVVGITHINNSATSSAVMSLLLTPPILFGENDITLTRTANATITDEAGNLLPTLTNHPVTNGIPTVPFVVSVSGTDGFYNLDDPLAVTVLFSEPINLNVGTATLHVFTQPSCGLNGCGFTATNTSLTTQLSFRYDVLQNDDTRDLAYTGINALVLQGGGTIRNAANNIDADLTLPEPGQEGSLSANSAIVLDTFKPTFPDPSTPTSPHGVTVGTNTAATSTVYNAQATDNSRGADTGITYALSGTHAATFELDTDLGVLTPMATLTGVATYSVTLTATDEADNVSDTFYLEITVSELPTVNISNNIATGTVANRADGDITFMLWFSEDVTGFESTDVMVSGGTRGVVTLPDGSQPNPATTYGSANTFTFLATPTTNTDDGVLTVTVAANAATAGAGRGTVAIEHIQMYDTLAPELSLADIYYILNDSPTEAFDADATDGTGDADADITYSLGTSADDNLFDIDTDSGVATYMATPTDGDTHAPTVTATDEAGNTAMSAVNISVVNRATVESVSGVDGFYKAGDEVLITVTFSEAVVVANSPLLSLNTGAADGAPNAAFHSGDGSSTAALTFLYTVEADDNTSDLAYASGPNQITLLPSTTIRNADAAINANLALPDPGTAGSLSANSAIVLDTAAPVFTSGPTGVVAVNSATSVIAYDAQAADNAASETPDEGVTYTLGDSGDNLLFTIDPDDGEVRYNDIQTTASVDHSIIITATDVAGNATMHNVSIGVRDAPEVRITDSVTSTYTNAAVTFTIRFTEAVTGFEATDVTVTGSSTYTLTETLDAATTYMTTDTFTLVATPLANTNDGTLTVTVAANAVMGTQTSAGNPLATAEQRYDTMVPVLPEEEGLYFLNDPPAAALDLNGYDVNGDTDSVTYSFGGGTNDNLFTLDSDTGMVHYINPPADGDIHSIDIIATDKGGNTAIRRNLNIFAVTRATVTSVGGVDGFYNEGATVPVLVTFGSQVAVTDTPQLTLNTGNISVGTAIYSPSTGTSDVLTFTYTVRAGDNTSNLAYTGTGALSLNGGRITNGGRAARLTLPGVGDTNSLSGSSAIVLDTIAPVFPAPGDATSDSDPLMLVLATGAADTTEVHNAEATDNGGASETADDGITYALSGTGTDADAFSFDTATGVLTPAASPTAAGTYTLTITATDQAGNATIQHIRVNVVALPTVNITDTITGTANLADGDITFMLWFSEDVTGFEASDLTVTGHSGTTPSLSPMPNMATTYGTANTFTLVVTPLSGTDSGALTIAVAADAATTTDGTSRMTVGISHEQPYDTQAPDAPTFSPIGSFAPGYLTLNRAGDTTIGGGGRESDAPVTLCLADTAAGTGEVCGGASSGRTTRVTMPLVGDGWSYTLTTADITAMGEGSETLYATATDAAGNPSPEASVDITVDTVDPPAPSFATDIATDLIISADERDNGVILTGATNSADTTTVTLCLGAATLTDAACATGTSRTSADGVSVSSMVWSYTLTIAEVNAMDQGDEILTAIGIDIAGNPSVAGGTTLSVDTTVPMFTSGDTGVVGISAPITTVAYDAQATDNGGGTDDGVTYSLTGGTDVGLFNIMDAAIGEVRYNDIQSALVSAHSIIITATDVAGNTNTQSVTISVREAPEVIITGGTSGYVNSAVTFFFSFSEDVTDFAPTGDVSVDNGSGGAISPPPVATDTYGTANTFSLVVTPTTSDNDGVLTVTVNAGAVMRAGGTATNTVVTATQQYDNVAPLLALDDVNYIIDVSPLLILNADATDGGNVDAGITYSLGGADALTFMIDADDGMVSYRNAQTTADTHNISIRATDKGNNTTTAAVAVNVARRATVTSVSASPVGTFYEGILISIIVAFDEDITLNGLVSDVQLELNTGNISGVAVVNAGGVTNGNELFFTYTVLDGDNTSALAYTSINALTIMGSTTIQTQGGIDVTPALPMPGSAMSLSGGTSPTALDAIIPVFPDAMDAATPLVRTIATNSTIGTLVYDAQATNNGGALETPDDGVTYALAGTQAARFLLDTATGVLTTMMEETSPATYILTITATDEATNVAEDTFLNVATQHLSVVVSDVPTATIAPIGTGTANIADGALTFTLSFSESVTGFETGDLTFGGGTLNSISQTPVAGDTYTSSDLFTILATPDSITNDGTLTVTLLANAAHSPTDTARLTPIATASRMYDTQAPGEPTFSAASITALEAINRAEENAGVPLNGTVESGVPMVLFCFNDGTGSVSTCTGGLPASTVSIGTTWSFTLTSTSIDTIGEGAATMRVVAADAAGNNSTAVSTPIFIDTVPPATAPRFNLIADDNTINIAERAAGVTVSGTTATDVTAVTLCADATDFTDALCVGGTTYTTSVSAPTWSSRLTTADITDDLADGSIALTAIATDMAGNPIVSDIYPITVDTVAPVFTNGATGTGSVAVGSTSATATAYDADATNNGGNADTGITYSLGGTDAGQFSIVPDTGIVIYNNVQNTAIEHRITITATDTAGNPATQDVTINVRNVPVAFITDNFAGEYTASTVTFTLSFSEAVTGFGDSFSAAGGETSTITPTPLIGNTYTSTDVFTIVSPLTINTNNGELSVTIPADEVTSVATGTGNVLTVATQKYDTLDPQFPASSPVMVDHILNDPGTTNAVYDADAADGTDDADAGLSYSLLDDTLFSVDPNTGIVSYRTTPVDGDSGSFTIGATDKAGNTAAAIMVNIRVADRATVSSVRLGDSGPFAELAVITISVDFSTELIAVTGTPQLTLDTGNTSDGTATYIGRLNNALFFEYTVRAGDNTLDLAYTGTDALTLNGGTIRGTGANDGIDANLTLPVPGAENSLSATSEAVLDNTGPVFPGTPTTSTTPIIRTIATGSAVGVTAYDANATDRGRMADEGISYTLVPTHTRFAIDSMTGIITTTMVEDGVTNYNLTFTATDEVGNVSVTRHLQVSVADLPTVTIERVGDDTVNGTSGALTYTLVFSEDVTGFERSDITVTGGTLGAITPSPNSATTYGRANTFTLLVTPNAGINAGMLTITAVENAVLAVSGTDRNSVEGSSTILNYDTLAIIPTITPPVAEDDIISTAERSISVRGTWEDGTLILCANPTNPAATTCAGGRSHATATTNATDWTVTLAATDIRAITPGIVILTAIATDMAGNIAVSLPHSISIEASVTPGAPVAVTLPGGLTGRVTATEAGSLRVEAATNTAAVPSGIVFTLAADISVTSATDADVPSTVCLSTTGVPTGVEPILFHLPGTAADWEEIGRDTATAAGFVCGDVATFSPFSVGYEEQFQRLSTISQVILPEVGRAITDTTLDAITRRFEQAGTGSQPTGADSAFTLGGQSTLGDVLTTGGLALLDGTLDLYDVMSRSSFVLPVNSLTKRLTLWGGGNYRSIGHDGEIANWDGALFSGQLGVDALVREDVLAGAAVGWTKGDFSYGSLADNPTEGGGDYSIALTNVTPYAKWSVLPGDRLSLWGTVGYGWGEVTIDDSVVETTQTSDVTLQTAGGGISAQVLKTPSSRIRVKGEIMQTSMDLEGQDSIAALTVESRRVRLGLEGKYQSELDHGRRLDTTMEAGMRYDGGDGRTGTGAEIGGGVIYTDPDNWITLSSQGRVLLGHTGNYDDWGIGGIVTVKQAASGQGLAFRLAPTYGQTGTNTAQLWDQGAMDMAGTNAAALGRRMDAEVGYGLAIADGQNLLTPYGNLTWGQGQQDYRLGSRLTLHSGLTMSLSGARGIANGRPAEHRLEWQTGWRWITASLQASGLERRLQLNAAWEW